MIKQSVHIPTVFENIISDIKSSVSGEINSINIGVENTEYFTDHINLLFLKVGMLIEIDNVQFEVLEVDYSSFSVKNYGFSSIPTEWNIAIYYNFGHLKEINKILASKQNVQINRFPLVWLMLDIIETKNNYLAYETEATLKFSFSYFSKSDYLAEQRADNIINKYLQPIVDLFIHFISSNYKDFYFDEESVNWNEIKRYKYGSQEKDMNIFNTVTDAIEIEIQSLKIKNTKNNCLI